MKKNTTKAPQPIASDEINDKEMMSLLVDLVSTNYWPAILKFNRTNDIPAIGMIATLDPVKEPTKLSRTQGWRNGLYFMEQTIDKEKIIRDELNPEKI